MVLIVARFLLFLMFLASIWLPLRACLRWRAPWRYWALLPLALPVFFVVRSVVLLVMDPQAYTLSAAELMLATFGGLGITALLYVLYARTGR